GCQRSGKCAEEAFMFPASKCLASVPVPTG
ncbi:hypothetical protein A2U01_0086030, partial [Trifolium medium]|nr:hypothetical protein [Trifolium medium]